KTENRISKTEGDWKGPLFFVISHSFHRISSFVFRFRDPLRFFPIFLAVSTPFRNGFLPLGYRRESKHYENSNSVCIGGGGPDYRLCGNAQKYGGSVRK